ncbi:hypothetical protein HPB52_009378 [Rhipicephalus sanguineus]|uniref:Uncharacterized protein n=1 Tax=Rhipicephalus sanguineus TaxID=34632 RepID=A0A9D4PRD9_RHISA|nr:hypothetical protein HPB52_009378 [Rhipicephalus sanguineus]
MLPLERELPAAVLDTLRLLQEKGFGEVPAHLSCTDLPQYWRRPRGDTIKGSSLQNVDWRRVGEGGRDLPLPCRIDLSAIKERNVEDWRKDLAQFAQALSDANADSALVTVLAAADRAPVCSSRCGTVFCGSPLAYQQPLVPHGFTVLLCSYLGEKLNKHDKSATPCLPKPMVPFTGSSQWAIPGGISGGERRILEVHLKAAGGSGWEDERRTSALISALGVEGQRKYFAVQEQLEAQGIQNAPCTTSTPAALGTGAVLTTEAAATTEYNTLLQFLDGLFAETTNVLAEWHLFLSRKQLPGETFLDFVAALKEKALSCKFGATYDDRMRDQIIHGVVNAHVRAKLLSYGEALRLQKAEEVGCDLEALNKANAAFGENERLLG